MAWFRFYTEALHDPKVQRLCAGDFKAWVNLLCCAKLADEGGLLPERGILAYKLRQKPYLFFATLSRLISVGLIDEDAGQLRIHAWEKRQFVSDNPTPRVQKHRSRNVSETPRARTDTEQKQKQSRTETEAEAEADVVLALLASLYQENFGTINSSADASLRDWAERIPDGDIGIATVKYVFDEATANNVMTWAYVQGVLKRLEAEGWPCDDADAEPVDRTAELNAEVERVVAFRQGATA